MTTTYKRLLSVVPRWGSCISRRSESILASKAAKAVLKKDDKDVEKIPPLSHRTEVPASYRYIYPEFLADPSMSYRNLLREKLERLEMLKRRSIIDIPEFYPGSIMAVTTSDPNAPNKASRFVGICICRGFSGLKSFLILRNVIDGLGVEIMYDMYNPTIRKFEVLRLERRLDEQLFYLRDCPLEHSTFPFDMEYMPHPHGAAIPLNETVIKLNPLPWLTRWELHDFRGITYEALPEWREKKRIKHLKPIAWEKYDVMAKYRKTIPLDEQEEMFNDVWVFNNAQFEKKKSRR